MIPEASDTQLVSSLNIRVWCQISLLRVVYMLIWSLLTKPIDYDG